ncbi:MAG: hypothetical protein AAGG48_17565 [Planctomycetota bacterium]
MKKFLFACLAAVLVGELGGGFWLYQQRSDLDDSEQEVLGREQRVSDREKRVTKRESEAREKEHSIAVVEERLDERKNELDEEAQSQRVRTNQLSNQANDIKQRMAELTTREEEEDEEDENHVLVMDIIRSTMARVRANIEAENLSGGGGEDGGKVPGGPNSPIGPDIASDLESERFSDRESYLSWLETRFQSISTEQQAPDVEIPGRLDSIKQLVDTVAELEMRGAPEAYTLKAISDVDIAFLKTICRVLGVGEEIIPSNQFEFLNANALDKLSKFHSKKIVDLKKRQALNPGLFTSAISEQQRVLEQIEEAKGKRPFDCEPLLVRALLKKKLSPDQVAIITKAASESVRSSQIRLRESQLLAKALSLEPFNPGLHLLYKQNRALLTPDQRSSLPDFTSRIACLEQIRAASPEDPRRLAEVIKEFDAPAADAPGAAKEFFARRYSDPTRAAGLLVQLEATFERSTGNQVSSENRSEFTRFMFDLLSRGDAYEVESQYLKPTSDLFVKAAALGIPAIPHPDDGRDLKVMRESCQARVSGVVSPPQAPALLADVPRPQLLYNKLRVMNERAAGPVIQDSLNQVALLGITEQVNALDRTARAFNEQKSRYTKSAKAAKDIGEFVYEDARVETGVATLAETAARLQLSLSKIDGEFESQEKVQRLRESLAAYASGSSSPEAMKEAAPFSDPIVKKNLGMLSETTISLKQSTTRVDEKLRIHKAALEVAELSYHFHGDRLPHEYSEGEVMEEFKSLSKKERIERFADVFKSFGSDKVIALRDSLRAAKSGKLDRRNQELGNYVDFGAVFLGRDSLGREYYRIDGNTRVLHKTPDGSVMNCPVYIP